VGPAEAPASSSAPAASGPGPNASAAPAEAPAANASAPGTPPKPGTPGYDPCQDSPPLPHPFTGLLRTARCDQDMYLKMAFEVADPLGVQCTYCHAPLATDPKKQDFPVITPKKEIANWMGMHMAESLRHTDGSKVKCKSCHVDADGKPVAKILGNPRDLHKAQEWMSMVLVNKFVTAKGEKLKCKSCHGGNYSTPQWKPKVILQTAQLPPH
jgi:hypothetical protein